MDLVGKLRTEILTERMRPGEKLTEQAISDTFKVSRTPVREALRSLEAEGLVEMIPNRGAFVIGFTENDIRDLYILRANIEVLAVRWAVERRTPEELEAIEETIDFMRFYTERNDVKRMRTINESFHGHIALASHNRIVVDILSRIQDYIKYSIHIMPYRESDLAALLKEHKSIFSAFKHNDPEAGAAAMKKHVENSLKRAKI